MARELEAFGRGGQPLGSAGWRSAHGPFPGQELWLKATPPHPPRDCISHRVRTVITGSPEDFFIQGLAGSGSCLPFLPPWVINVLSRCLPEEHGAGLGVGLRAQPEAVVGGGPGEPRSQSMGQVEIVWEVLCVWCRLPWHVRGPVCLPSRTATFSLGVPCVLPTSWLSLAPAPPETFLQAHSGCRGQDRPPAWRCLLTGLGFAASGMPGHRASPKGSAESLRLALGPIQQEQPGGNAVWGAQPHWRLSLELVSFLSQVPLFVAGAPLGGT